MAGGIVLPSLSGLPRLPDADQRLQRLVIERMAMPFAWGRNDCALWAADAVLAQLGQDPAQALRGTYATARQCRHVLGHIGTLASLATSVLGQPLERHLQARQGDIGLMRWGHLAVRGADTWLVVANSGLGHQPIEDAVQAWRVGHA